MPGSATSGKLTILKWFEQIPAKRTILDVGPGWATYSKLLRQPGQVWHAIEIHKPYIERFSLTKYYDKIFVLDVCKFNPKITYDVIILGDVIEHIRKNQSISTLGRLFKKSQWCIVSIPLDEETHAPTDNCNEYWNNQHEEHVAAWSNKAFMQTISGLGGEIVAMEKYRELGIYLIATQTKKKYISEYAAKPIEWFLFHYTHWFENKEEGTIQRYKRKIRNRINKYSKSLTNRSTTQGH